MSIKYTEDLKREVVRDFLKAEKTAKEIAKKYNLAESTVRGWVNKYSEEFTYADEHFNLEQSKKIREMQTEILELKKENRFLIETSAFFAKHTSESKKK